MCCKKDSKGNWYIEPETVTRTVALVKWLMQEFNIPIDRVIRHYDVCWKTCPEPWVRYPEQWQAFKKRLVEPEEEEEMQRYKTVEELPKTYQKDIQKLVDLGKLKGKGGDAGLDLTEDMARTLIICGRMTGVL
jgi:N-acetylmuramoyl-L-alanine amidase CwlA